MCTTCGLDSPTCSRKVQKNHLPPPKRKMAKAQNSLATNLCRRRSRIFLFRNALVPELLVEILQSSLPQAAPHECGARIPPWCVPSTPLAQALRCLGPRPLTMSDCDSDASLGPRGCQASTDSSLGPRGRRSSSSDSDSSLGPRGCRASPRRAAPRVASPRPSTPRAFELCTASAAAAASLAIVPLPVPGPLAVRPPAVDVWAGREMVVHDVSPMVVEESTAALALAEALRPADDMQRALTTALGQGKPRKKHKVEDLDLVAAYVVGEIPRPVSNITAEARLVGVTEYVFKKEVKDLAMTTFQYALLLDDMFLGFICGLIDSGLYLGVSCLELLHWDETSMMCRVQMAEKHAYGSVPGETLAIVPAGGQPTPLAKRMRYAKVTAKLMAVHFKISIVLCHVPTNKFVHFTCNTPHRYFNLDKNTGETTHESVRRTRRAFPRIVSAKQRCIENGLGQGNDRAGQNQRTDRKLGAEAPPTERVSRFYCFMHCAQSAQGWQLDTNKRLVSGVLNTGCSYTTRGAVELARGSLRPLIRARLRCHRGVAPPGPDSAESRFGNAILNTFIPGDDPSSLQRCWVIMRLDNGALWSEWWDHFCIGDCCQGGRSTLECFLDQLVDAYIPRACPKAERGKWVGVHKAVEWIGLLENSHGAFAAITVPMMRELSDSSKPVTSGDFDLAPAAAAARVAAAPQGFGLGPGGIGRACRAEALPSHALGSEVPGRLQYRREAGWY